MLRFLEEARGYSAGPSVKSASVRPANIDSPVHKEDRAGMANVHNQIRAGVQLKNLKGRVAVVPRRPVEVSLLIVHSSRGR